MLVRAKVKAGARRERLFEPAPGHFEIDVKVKAEANAANRRVKTLIANRLGVSQKAIRIIAGVHRPNKVFRVLT